MSMDVPENFEAFQRQALSQGFEEVVSRTWAPNTHLDTHTHPFHVDALVVAGALWLTVNGESRHLQPGDRFSLERDVPHAEVYGPEGATYWVARRLGT
jgi:quercetin dioxygenase-like cupin family protein